MTDLRGYTKAISDATGVSDPATLAEIEEFMRDENRTLDGLSRDDFRRSARQCWAVVAYLRTPLGQAEMAREERMIMGGRV